MFKHLLLCTHGTEGAQKAEAFVFKQLTADPNLKVSVLTILDEDWRMMTGDDWLNSSKTHTAFLDHVEAQVSEEIAEEWQRIRDTYPAAAQAVFLQRTGAIAETITRVAEKLHCDLIAIGPYQKSKGLFIHGEKGLRARIKNDTLHPLLPCPLLIAP
ncbi:MAG: universal stress protein [Proteobacteria bacterium]|nr:universal stress protein [Pseudomonadota bacterium]MBU1138812.1 universal stress protein [Pseudomonadota bacterium]MBU1419201.1 universal stress protein [Pseudomonadota bacterium]MBU1456287.1 universal stress protein [Pseudomonadota bacterium]